MNSNPPYSPGDWVVHRHYGVGKIICIEAKPIGGKKTKCYKVKTKDCTYWFSTNDIDNPRIRPVASEEIVRKVVYHLRRKAGKLDKDKSYWKKRIAEVKTEGDILSISKLVRDLSAVQVIRSLNAMEEKALEEFEERLAMEWASSTKEDVEEIRPTLRKHIKVSKSKVDIGSYK